MSEFRPSLKICIDNTKDKNGDSDSESGAEDGEITASSSSSSSSSGSSDSGSGSDSGSSSDSENDGADKFTISVDDRPTTATSTHRSRLTEEVMRKREERSKRFGIWHNAPKVSAADLDILYKSLGITELDLKENPRGLRLEAIHLRRVDEMSTEDILEYFRAYAPGCLEWIGDSSCNVVWLDSMSAARAMFNVSKDQEAVMADYKKRKERRKSKKDSKERVIDKKPEQPPPTESNDIEMEDDDVLDLLADDEIDKTPTPPPEQRSAEDKMETGDKSQESETGSISESDDEPGEFPPGKWRLGPPTEKSKGLFMRFALRADRKKFGAEQNSQYYQKYGNQGFGGMTGLISASRKRKMGLERNMDELEGTNKAARSQALKSGTSDTPFDVHTREAADQHSLPKRAQPEVPVDDMFGDISSLETFAVEVRAPKPKPKPTAFVNRSDDDEEEGEVEEDYHHPEPSAERSPAGDREEDDDDDDMDVERELQELLAPTPPKRYMRMHADDVEDQLSNKSSEPASTFGRMDARSKIEHRRREKKHGLLRDEPVPLANDLRSRLGNRASFHSVDEEEGPRKFEKLTVQLYND